MKNHELLSELTPEDFCQIEDLAAQNYAPSTIAQFMDLNKAAFLRLWRDKASSIRNAYEKGKLAIHQEKQITLEEKVQAGDLKAIEIHDRRASEQRFEDIKRDIFNFE